MGKESPLRKCQTTLVELLAKFSDISEKSIETLNVFIWISGTTAVKIISILILMFFSCFITSTSFLYVVPCQQTHCITSWVVLTRLIGAAFNREPPIPLHVQDTPPVRMAAHLNQNNGSLHHLWWDILIYVNWVDLYLAMKMCKALPASANCDQNQPAYASLFLSLSAVTLNHQTQTWSQTLRGKFLLV